jgi:hypothetical protein
VAQPGAIAQRAGGPDGATPRHKQLLSVQRRERGDHAGGAMAPLRPDSVVQVQRAIRHRRPVGELALDDRQPRRDLDRLGLDAALRQRERVAGEAVGEADVAVTVARHELLRPEPVVVAAREEVVGQQLPLVVEPEVVGQDHHPGRSIEEIERGVAGVGRDQLAQAVAARDREDACAAVEEPVIAVRIRLDGEALLDAERAQRPDDPAAPQYRPRIGPSSPGSKSLGCSGHRPELSSRPANVVSTIASTPARARASLHGVSPSGS